MALDAWLKGDVVAVRKDDKAGENASFRQPVAWGDEWTQRGKDRSTYQVTVDNGARFRDLSAERALAASLQVEADLRQRLAEAEARIAAPRPSRPSKPVVAAVDLQRVPPAALEDV